MFFAGELQKQENIASLIPQKIYNSKRLKSRLRSNKFNSLYLYVGLNEIILQYSAIKLRIYTIRYSKYFPGND